MDTQEVVGLLAVGQKCTGCTCQGTSLRTGQDASE
ncbi:MAG: hypothetical protein ACI8UD_001856, partial [Planctomycetota bacterium]